MQKKKKGRTAGERTASKYIHSLFTQCPSLMLGTGWGHSLAQIAMASAFMECAVWWRREPDVRQITKLPSAPQGSIIVINDPKRRRRIWFRCWGHI